MNDGMKIIEKSTKEWSTKKKKNMFLIESEKRK